MNLLLIPDFLNTQFKKLGIKQKGELDMLPIKKLKEVPIIYIYFLCQHRFSDFYLQKGTAQHGELKME
jgi:hypothetical protein